MDSKKTQEELEKPAKVYQVDALQTEIVAVRKLLEEQNGFIKGAASLEYVEGRIKSVTDAFDAKLSVIKAEYRPILGSAKWVARTAIGAFVSIMLVILGIYLKS